MINPMTNVGPLAGPMSGPRVLVVDDDPDIRDIIAYALKHRLDAVVTAVPDAYQALAWLESEPFDVLALDLVLPGAGGIEVLDRMRGAGIVVATIVISAMGSGPLVNRLADHHVFRLVTKPFDLVALANSVAAAARSVRAVMPQSPPLCDARR